MPVSRTVFYDRRRANAGSDTQRDQPRPLPATDTTSHRSDADATSPLDIAVSSRALVVAISSDIARRRANAASTVSAGSARLGNASSMGPRTPYLHFEAAGTVVLLPQHDVVEPTLPIGGLSRSPLGRGRCVHLAVPPG